MPSPKSDEVTVFWEDMPHKQGGCVGCGATEHHWKVPAPIPLWRCCICHARVCFNCTKTIDDRGKEYHGQTFCSTKCWEAGGSPED